ALVVDGVAGRPLRLVEGPAVAAHVPGHDRHRDDVFELLELAKNDRPRRPWAGERDIEVIAPGPGLKSAFARRACAAVDRDPVAKLRVGADEVAVLGAILVVLPHAID